ncbi:MAG: hypothetical protein ABL967_08595 [Bryobacteraceae bacterium]
MKSFPKSNQRSERGNEVVEFAFVAIMFIPLILGSFMVGMNLVKSIAVNHVVRDLNNMYIHGADFSVSSYQQLALRLASGVNLKAPVFPTGSGNLRANTGNAGDGLIWITQLMYVGGTNEPTCTSVGSNNCSNHDSFVYTQRIIFGNSALLQQKQSTLGDAATANISNSGIVQNYLTDSGARLPSAAQSDMRNLWMNTANGRQPLADGQVIYAVEGYFQSPSLAVGSTPAKGVYARYFF